jgi:hypothetical protein
MAKRTLAAALALTATLTATHVMAQSDADKATARELALEGDTAIKAKDYVTAADRFKRADSLYHAPSLLVQYARAEVGLGKLVAAYEAYNRIVREGAPTGSSPIFVKAVEDAKKELAALEPRIPWLVLKLDGPGAADAKVTLDDGDFPSAAIGVRRAVDPGKHLIKAHAPGGPEAQRLLDVSEGGTATITLTVEAGKSTVETPVPAVTSPPVASATPKDRPGDGGDTKPVKHSNTLKILGIASLGVGGAGIIAGAVGGILALSKSSDLADSCDASARCPLRLRDDVSSYQTYTKVANLGFTIGVLGVAAGTVLLILAPSAPKSDKARLAPSVSPFIGVGNAGVQGRF